MGKMRVFSTNGPEMTEYIYGKQKSLFLTKQKLTLNKSQYLKLNTKTSKYLAK